jgi:hypothetical protein
MSSGDETRFAANRAVEAAEYQSLCALAVIALALGMASVAVLATPLLLIVPVAAVGAGFVALRKIGASDGVLAGSAAARWGIGLAIACVATMLVRDGVRDELMKRQTTELARRWFSLLAEEKIDEALALLSGEAANSLVPPPATPESPPIPADQAKEIADNRLRNDPLTKYLQAGDGGAVTVGSLSAPSFDGPRTYIDGDFTISRQGGLHRHATLQLVRIKGYELEGTPWRINRWELGGEHGAH